MNKKIAIDIEANTKQAAAGISQVTEQLNKLTKQPKLSMFAKWGSTISGISSAVELAGKAYQFVKAALNECSEAYKEQAKAEVQLETAAKNNPYLNDSSVRALKNYASQLQSISTVGDEKLLPLMAQLASAGRTQAEIQSIMSAALDASASGAISLEAAVKGLNASYSGQAGSLGKILPQVKNLTAEELKQGKAVQLVAESYKGMAAETAKSVGASEQLKNAWGDFKENIGQGWEEATAPAKRELAGLLGQINEVNKRKKELKGAESNIESGNAGEVDYEIKLEEVTDRLKAAREELAAVQATIDSGAGDLGTAYALGEAQRKLEALTAEFVSYEKIKGRTAKIAQEEAEAAEKARKEAEAQAAAEKAIADAKKRANDLATNALDAYDKAIQKAELEIEARRQLGETVSQAEEDQIMFAAKKAAYENMIVSAQGAISGNLDREKKKREEIAELAERVAQAELVDKYAKKGEERNKETWESQKAELEEARAAIEAMQDSLVSDLSLTTDQKIALEKKYAAAVEEINREIAEGEKQTNEQRFKSFQEVFNQIGSYVQQTAQLIQQAMQFQLEAVQAERDLELATLEDKYRKGEITEEQYNAKKEEIEKEAAQKEYKIKMWEWAANIAQATANIAMAAVGAMAQTSGNAAARIIAMSLIGAAGGIQLASLIASKPVPPSFATGGVVGGFQGASFGGDNTYIHARQGEMILNAAQQRNLWETANGRGSNGGGMNIVINNSAANIVDAKPRVTASGIELLIDARVKKAMADGKYNSALTQANQSMDGIFYGV